MKSPGVISSPHLHLICIVDSFRRIPVSPMHRIRVEIRLVLVIAARWQTVLLENETNSMFDSNSM